MERNIRIYLPNGVEILNENVPLHLNIRDWTAEVRKDLGLDGGNLRSTDWRHLYDDYHTFADTPAEELQFIGATGKQSVGILVPASTVAMSTSHLAPLTARNLARPFCDILISGKTMEQLLEEPLTCRAIRFQIMALPNNIRHKFSKALLISGGTYCGYIKRKNVTVCEVLLVLPAGGPEAFLEAVELARTCGTVPFDTLTEFYQSTAADHLECLNSRFKLIRREGEQFSESVADPPYEVASTIHSR